MSNANPEQVYMNGPLGKKALAMKLSKSERRERLKKFNPANFGLDRAMEADFERLGSVGDWTKLDDKTYAKLKDYYKFHAKNVRAHHHAQEEHFVPKLIKLFPEYEADITAIIYDEHKIIEEMLKGLDSAFEHDEKAKILDLFTKYRTKFSEHIDLEEMGTIVMAERFTEDMLNKLEKELFAEMMKDEFQANLEWFVYSMDDEARTAFFKKLPPPVRWIWKLALRPRFERRIKIFRQFQANK